MTGRRRFNCVSPQTELEIGDEYYAAFLRTAIARGMILSENHPLTLMVNSVSRRLVEQAPIEGVNWKVHVIKDDRIDSAFVLPRYVMQLR